VFFPLIVVVADTVDRSANFRLGKAYLELKDTEKYKPEQICSLLLFYSLLLLLSVVVVVVVVVVVRSFVRLV
jgi:hypothetical protein